MKLLEKETFENGLAQLTVPGHPNHRKGKTHILTMTAHGVTILCHPEFDQSRLLETGAQSATCKVCLRAAAKAE